MKASVKLYLGGFKEIRSVLIYLNILNFKKDLVTLEYDDRLACIKLKKFTLQIFSDTRVITFDLGYHTARMHEIFHSILE